MTSARSGGAVARMDALPPEVRDGQGPIVPTSDRRSVAAARGTGQGRALLDHVHAMSAAHPQSPGVSLSTEVPGNVPMYEHFGYRVVGSARVAPELTTWVMFRRDP